MTAKFTTDWTQVEDHSPSGLINHAASLIAASDDIELMAAFQEGTVALLQSPATSYADVLKFLLTFIEQEFVSDEARSAFFAKRMRAQIVADIEARRKSEGSP